MEKKKGGREPSLQHTHTKKSKKTHQKPNPTLNIFWKLWSFVGCNTSIKWTRLMIWDKVAINLRILYSGAVSVIWASAIPESLLSPRVWITSSDMGWSALTVTRIIWNLSYPNRLGILTAVLTESPATAACLWLNATVAQPLTHHVPCSAPFSPLHRFSPK